MFDVSPKKISLRPLSLLAALPLSLLLSGCGAALQSTSPSSTSALAISGTLFGGRTPISGATMSIYTVGKTGYGSAATQIGGSILSSSSGDFQFPAGTLTSCAAATPNAPIYLISVGGNAGAGTNSAAVLAANLGTCGSAAANLVVNEVTTTALAFSLSHFFATSAGGVTDTFGGPAGTGTYAPYAFGLGLATAHTIPAIVNVATGTTAVNSSTFTIDSAKIYSIANALAACVNTTGPTSTQCKSLFTSTTAPGASTAPADTLQAAVNMALYPYQNVSTIFALGPANGAPYIGLPAAPADWTIGVSYKSSAFGLELNAGTLTTIDIDSTGKVWFPSNVAGAVGVGNFDPSSGAFFGPYTASGLTHPQQVAIDNTSHVWVNDSAGSSLYSFSVSNSTPPPATVYTLANTISTSLSINDNNIVDVGIQNTSSGAYYLATAGSGNSYTQLGTSPAPTYIQSIASDGSGSNAVSLLTASGPTATADYVAGSAPNFTAVVSAQTDNPGQMLFTGANYIMALPQSSATGVHDSICVFGSTCAALTSTQALSPYGIAIDGDGAIWMADAANSLNANSSSNTAYAGAQTIPLLSPGTYVGSTGTAANHAYFHGTGNGATATTPYGIAIDNSGNVWMSNVGCVITAPATSCTPGSFVLTELIGAAAPTYTPVSTTIVGTNTAPGTRP